MKRLILLAATMIILTGCGTNDDSEIIEKNEISAIFLNVHKSSPSHNIFLFDFGYNIYD